MQSTASNHTDTKPRKMILVKMLAHTKMPCTMYVKFSYWKCVCVCLHLNTPDSDMKMRMYTQRNMRHDTHMSCCIMSFYFNNKYMFWLHLVTNHGSQGRPKTKKKVKMRQNFSCSNRTINWCIISQTHLFPSLRSLHTRKILNVLK